MTGVASVELLEQVAQVLRPYGLLPFIARRESTGFTFNRVWAAIKREALDIEEHYAQENPHLPEGPRRLLREYVEAGRLGVKTGQGFYHYDDQDD